MVPGRLLILLPLFCNVIMTAGESCIKKYDDGKWKSYGNCPTQRDYDSVLSQIKSAAKEEKDISQVKAESSKCQGKALKRIPVTFSNGTTINRYASMTGGWTVIQRREDGSVNFTRNWVEYVDGFGHPCGEYWLGLEAIYKLTKDGDQKLRIEMIENGTEIHYWAEYSVFRISSAFDHYRLTVSGFSGNTYDALSPNTASWGIANGVQFSTIDADHDLNPTMNCASQSGGGWWHRSCSLTRLNGRYGGQGFQGITWAKSTPQGYQYVLMRYVEMKIRNK